MTSLRLLVVLLSVPCIITTAAAQQGMSNDSKRLLDTSLRILGMNRADCAMPPDLLPTDEHRLPWHDRLFSDPFGAFGQADGLARLIAERSDNSMDLAARAAFPYLDLTSFRRSVYDSRITADELIRRLRIDPSDRAGFVGSTLLLRYLSALVQAADGMSDAAARFRNQKILVDMCDTLWQMSRENETSSLWQLHDDEMKGMERASAFFLSSSLAPYHDIYTHGWSAYLHILQYARESLQSNDLLRDSIRSMTFSTPYGRVAIGGKGDDVYEGTYFLIIDIGGNDLYRFDLAAKEDALDRPVRCIVDLAGNDLYTAGSYELGSAVGGVGILIDAAGNDTYLAGDASLGCGIFGVGIVHDMAGDDSYSSGINSQGAGIFGIGLVLDDGGQDIYRAHAQAQGFGATRGIGILSDLAGNDQYLAASPYVDVLRYEAHQVTFTQGAALGYRPLASGGIGILADERGNDAYSTDIYGQGTGYWFGLGALLDRAGDDRYVAYQYAQGAGVHFATGILRDDVGDDIYVSHGVSQGCGHDIALGALIDEQGNDSYMVESLSLGGGNANAVSVFIDVTGNDAYVATHTPTTMGYSDFRRNYGMIGIFADGGGNDTYGASTRNNSVSVQSTYGVFNDADLIPAPAGTTSPKTPQYAAMPLAENVDSLFIQASAAPLRFQNNVQPARDRIVSLGVSALPHLATHFGTQMPRERLALEYILPKIHESNGAAVEALLRDSLSSDDPTVVSMCATVGGRIKMTSMVPSLMVLVRDDSWRKRRLAAITIGEIGDSSGIPGLKMLLKDDHPYVRSRAAFALGMIGGIAAFRTLQPLLAEEQQIVRYGAVEGLMRGTKQPAAPVVAWWGTLSNRTTLTSGLRLVGAVDTTTTDAEDVALFVKSAPRSTREMLYRILPSAPVFWKNQAATYLAMESDEALQAMLRPLAVSGTPLAIDGKKKKKSKKKK